MMDARFVVEFKGKRYERPQWRNVPNEPFQDKEDAVDWGDEICGASAFDVIDLSDGKIERHEWIETPDGGGFSAVSYPPQ